jgi:hypothetical protein
VCPSITRSICLHKNVIIFAAQIFANKAHKICRKSDENTSGLHKNTIIFAINARKISTNSDENTNSKRKRDGRTYSVRKSQSRTLMSVEEDNKYCFPDLGLAKKNEYNKKIITKLQTKS